MKRQIWTNSWKKIDLKALIKNKIVIENIRKLLKVHLSQAKSCINLDQSSQKNFLDLRILLHTNVVLFKLSNSIIFGVVATNSVLGSTLSGYIWVNVVFNWLQMTKCSCAKLCAASLSLCGRCCHLLDEHGHYIKLSGGSVNAYINRNHVFVNSACEYSLRSRVLS